MRKRRQGASAEEDRKSPGALSAPGLPRGAPEKLPTRRETERWCPKIVGPDGGHRVYVEVGRVDGQIVEVWIDVAHREGSVLRGFGHALARVASHALQHGMPLDVLVRSLLGSDGGPGGTVIDCAEVTEASSVPDLVGRLLATVGGVQLDPEPIS